MWFLIFDRATGALVSEAEVKADPMPAHLDFVESPQFIEYGNQRWDAAQRQVVPFVDADRLDALSAQRLRIAGEITRLGGVVKEDR